MEQIEKEPKRPNINKIFSADPHLSSVNDGPSIQPELAYYQRSILSILDSVNESYSNILNLQELELIAKLARLASDQQRLLFRLLLRKPSWLRANKLDYADIHDIGHVANCLFEQSLLEYSNQLDDYVAVLSVEELKILAKRLKLKTTNHGRDELARLLQCHSKNTTQQQLTIFAPCNHRNSVSKVPERKSPILVGLVGQLCGPILRVVPSVHQTFTQLVSLFSLGSGLNTAILVGLQRRKYPEYRIVRSSPLFLSRPDWLSYEQARCEHEYLAASLQKGVSMQSQFAIEADDGPMINSSMQQSLTVDDCLAIDSVEDKLDCIWRKWHARMELELDNTCTETRSYFLQRYTAGWVETTTLSSIIVPWYEQEKNYVRAVEILESLLVQTKYCRGLRGHWWERLIIDWHRHLNDPIEALRVAKRALQDEYIKSCSKLLFILRKIEKLEKATRIIPEPNGLVTIDLEREEHLDLDMLIKTVTLYADPQRIGTTGRKLQYQCKNTGDPLTVEQLVLAHFVEKGWKGIHSESTMFTTLFGLLFWDILFESEHPDVFQSPFEIAPLDLCTDSFYTSRRVAIEARLAEIAKFTGTDVSNDPLIERLAQVYKKFYGTMCIGVDWELIDFTDLVRICQALGGIKLAAILRWLAEDYKGRGAGIPDLVLWRTTSMPVPLQAANPDIADRTSCDLESSIDLISENFLLVEVKSPNDRLSDAQRYWAVLFKEIGVSMLVCRVKPEQSRPK